MATAVLVLGIIGLVVMPLWFIILAPLTGT